MKKRKHGRQNAPQRANPDRRGIVIPRETWVWVQEVGKTRKLSASRVVRDAIEAAMERMD